MIIRRGEQEGDLQKLDLHELSQQAILGAQRPAPCLNFKPPIIVLLKKCLLAQSNPVGYNALLSGKTLHPTAIKIIFGVNAMRGHISLQMEAIPIREQISF